MAFAEHAMRAARSGVAALAVTGAIVVAGCSGGAPAPTQAAAPASAAPSSTSADPSAGFGSGTGSGAGTCGEATAALVKKQLARTDVVSVTTDGGCHDATIVTSLAPTDATSALAICDAAALVAYAGDLSSVTVLAANGRELSIGIKGQPCIAEP